jgi:hypothetical protein
MAFEDAERESLKDGTSKEWTLVDWETMKMVFAHYADYKDLATKPGNHDPADLPGCHWHIHVDTSKEECQGKK